MEPGGLPSMGSYRVGHDRSDLAVAAAAAEQYKLKYIPASLSVNMSYHCPKNKKKPYLQQYEDFMMWSRIIEIHISCDVERFLRYIR